MIAKVDDRRVGLIVRALRRRRGWRQIDLAGAGKCSQSLISLVERGHLDRLSTKALRTILAALDATAVIERFAGERASWTGFSMRTTLGWSGG